MAKRGRPPMEKQKLSERLQSLLDNAEEPIWISKAARILKVSERAIRYWIAKLSQGDDPKIFIARQLSGENKVFLKLLSTKEPE
jgi:hypothetical protein